MKNLINGEWRKGESQVPNINPFTGEELSQSEQASAQDIEDAAQAAVRAFQITRRRSTHERAAILHKAAKLLKERAQEITDGMTAELGRPVTFNAGEVKRGIFTITNGAEEAMRLNGESMPLDLLPGFEDRYAYTLREAVGPVVGVTPFNFPVNLLLHKIVPAIAAGCPITVKIPPQTPDTPRRIGEIFQEAGCIAGELNLVDCAPDVFEPAIRDERYKLLSFTGSPAVGWKLKSIAGKKRVLLELGNASGVVVHHDVQDMEWALKRIRTGAFAAAGQVCISIQRIFVHEKIADQFSQRFVELVREMAWGDPSNPDAVAGPMVDDAAADKVESRLKAAIDGGARVLIGGGRDGRLIEPCVLSDVKLEMPIACDEIFGPVVSIWSYSDQDDVFGMVNATPFGLQAGVFSDSARFIERAIDQLDVAGVMVNEFPTFRIDHMPYGGIKDSGLGREGVKYALTEYTEPKLVVVNKRAW